MRVSVSLCVGEWATAIGAQIILCCAQAAKELPHAASIGSHPDDSYAETIAENVDSNAEPAGVPAAQR